jgi:hypothetical protein
MAHPEDPTQLHPSPDAIDLDLAEVGAAIALVGRGLATRVRLVGLTAPDLIAATALARAQAAGVGFRVERTAASTTLTIGPRLDEVTRS